MWSQMILVARFHCTEYKSSYEAVVTVSATNELSTAYCVQWNLMGYMATTNNGDIVLG